MASLRELPRSMRCLSLSPLSRQTTATSLRRCASSQAAEPATADHQGLSDLETNSSMAAPAPQRKGDYKDPVARALSRDMNLPSSRYQYHPPKYNRGPLHPIQSPLSSDAVARDFVPGPFNNPRLRQTYSSTIASDLMTLTYLHKPPGTEEREIGQRLRSWDDSSPYHKNRPLRAPRGDPVLRLVEKNIDFKYIPEIKAVTLVSYVPKSIKDPFQLIATRAALQALSSNVPEIIKAKKSVAGFGISKGKKTGAKVTIHGNEAYEFLDKCIHLVFPQIKDWPGVRGSTGDSSGNLSFGLSADDVALFPEIQVNWAQYPPKMIPGCRVYVETTAKSDRHARLLFQALGVPFYGRLRD